MLTKNLHNTHTHTHTHARTHAHTWSTRRLGSGEMTVRAEKSTRFPAQSQKKYISRQAGLIQQSARITDPALPEVVKDKTIDRHVIEGCVNLSEGELLLVHGCSPMEVATSTKNSAWGVLRRGDISRQQFEIVSSAVPPYEPPDPLTERLLSCRLCLARDAQPTPDDDNDDNINCVISSSSSGGGGGGGSGHGMTTGTAAAAIVPT